MRTGYTLAGVLFYLAAMFAAIAGQSGTFAMFMGVGTVFVVLGITSE